MAEPEQRARSRIAYIVGKWEEQKAEGGMN